MLSDTIGLYQRISVWRGARRAEKTGYMRSRHSFKSKKVFEYQRVTGCISFLTGLLSLSQS